MSRLPSRYSPYLWIAVLLILVESAIWILGLATGNPARLRMTLIHLAGFWPGLLGNWQPNFPFQPVTMFFSYWMIHAGPGHLAGNLAVLAWFAYRIGPALRPIETCEIWGASVLGGAAAFGLLAPSYAPMIGASGGVFGLLGSFVVIDFRIARSRQNLASASMRTLAVCTALIALSILDYVLRDAVLAWQAHMGGFLTGAAIKAATPHQNLKQ